MPRTAKSVQINWHTTPNHLDRCSFDSHWCSVRYHEKEIGIHSFICAGEKQLPYRAAFLLLWYGIRRTKNVFVLDCHCTRYLEQDLISGESSNKLTATFAERTGVSKSVVGCLITMEIAFLSFRTCLLG